MTVAHSALKMSLIAVNYTYLILLLLQHFLLLAILLMLIIVMEDFILKHSLGESLFYGRFPEQIDLLFSQGLCQGFLPMTSKGKNKHISFPLVVCFLGRHFADVGDFQSIAYLGLQPSPAPCFHC